MARTAELPPQWDDSEGDAYGRSRYRAARDAGMSIVEAQLFRDSDVPLGELRRLVELKCPSDLIPRILL